MLHASGNSLPPPQSIIHPSCDEAVNQFVKIQMTRVGVDVVAA